ncbi:uncharacterized protein LOC117235605 [Bombus vosnesenskii]|uniref:Uncharacterized protein LOC117235605 n=1 Tax=Bombus vosnesenskii TaxID=207650 RepID=A0A6J3KKH0_9HYME|nr:uncharacterized protein LOC117235605 [Bombus vosnesenskii]
MNYHVTRGREKALLNWLSGSMTNFMGWREISKGCDPFFRAGIYVRSVTVGASVVIQNEAGMYEEEARIKLTGAMPGATSLGSNTGQTCYAFLSKWDHVLKRLKRPFSNSFSKRNVLKRSSDISSKWIGFSIRQSKRKSE